MNNVVGMIDSKDFEAVPMVFRFVDGSVDRVTEYVRSGRMTQVHKTYIERVE